MQELLSPSNEVTQFLDGQSHPLRKEIEALRTCILQANSGLAENIKWNGPNYTFNGNDRITMRIHPPKQVQLVFHTGAKAKALPPKNLLEESSGLLQWKTTDRAIASFPTMASIAANKERLTTIINEWIRVTT
ncbi:MAG: DUF1801 domain-containing protein [Chitinophagaceae bacterium]|nr:MAG: DUF1801 domain-containing protein [Chitinophagaceae bacterium]